MQRGAILKRSISATLSFVLVFSLSLPCSALSDYLLDQYSANNIMFYDPDSSCYGALSGDTLVEKVLSFLLSQGLTDVAAAGVYGNMINEGLGAGKLLEHENGVDSRSDIGTTYNAKLWSTEPGQHVVQEKHVRELMDVRNMHGLGFIQWSFGRRVNLINKLAEKGLDKYATEWDESRGVYVYDGVTYDEMTGMIGQATADEILSTMLEFFMEEHESYVIESSDYNAQGLNKYSGITVGMPLLEAMSHITDASDAAQIFFTTSEMPGATTYQYGDKNYSYRGDSAKEGLDLIHGSNLSAKGPGKCSGGGNGGATIAKTAVSLAWPNSDGTCSDGGVRKNWEANKSECYDDAKPEYKEAMIRVTGADQALTYYQDCGHFVATVVRDSGIDSEFPLGGTSNMEPHMRNHPDLWEEIPNNKNTDNLKPGDIFVYNLFDGQDSNGHIMVYVGDEGKFAGDQYNEAGASLRTRTGNLGVIYYSSQGKDFSIFRSKVATNDDGGSISGDGEKPIEPLTESSDDVACATGTIDLGIYREAHIRGRQISIRMCALPNLPSSGSESTPGDRYYIDGANGKAVVNSRVSGAYYNLIERAKSKGLTVTASSALRSYAHQQALYNCYIYQNCNGGNTAAAPGTSNHEAGLAIDFNMAGGSNTINSCPSTPNWPNVSGNNWKSNLSKFFCENLGDFGLHRGVRNESWHVDPTY